MTNIYLTKQKKSYYSKDFESLLHCKDSEWGVDMQIKEILISINKNESIQTIYSKLNKFELNMIDNDLSYLEFCYSENIELELFRNTIPFFISKYNVDCEAQCYYLFNKPEKNINYIENAEKTGLGCLDDINYFNINNIGIYLRSKNKKIHTHFWNDLKVKLS